MTVDLVFENLHVAGASVQTFLFEKTRLTFQQPGESNFSIFYQLFAGLSLEERKVISMLHIEDFFYLNKSKDILAMSNYAESFQQLLMAFDILEITDEERKAIFSILAAILHLGNIYYGRTVKNGYEMALIVNNSDVEFVSQLLQIDPTKMTDILTQKIQKTPSEEYYKYCNVEEALDNRDNISRDIYWNLFKWLVRRVNEKCKASYEEKKIVLVDMHGFEDFDVNNGYEQLAVNFADEYIFAYTMSHIFDNEKRMYEDDILTIFDGFADGYIHGCIDLLCGDEVSLFNILNDACNHPRQPTDSYFLEQCHKHLEYHQHYENPKIPSPEFRIRHYAGKVKYQVDSFIHKNLSKEHRDIARLMTTSKSTFIQRLFLKGAKEKNSLQQASSVIIPLAAGRYGNGQHGNARNENREKYHLSAQKLKLQKLVKKLEGCTPFFVRCIRPNTSEEPMELQDNYVSMQIDYFSTMETINIRRNGFPVKMEHREFVERYRCLYMDGYLSPSGDPTDNATTLLSSIAKDYPDLADDFHIGQNMVLMKESLEPILEELRYQTLKNNAVIIQKFVKSWQEKKKFEKKRDAAVTIQARYRSFAARKRYNKVVDGITMFQKAYRKYKHDKRFIRSQRNELNRIQARQREYLSRFDPQSSDNQDFDMETDVSKLDIPPELAAVFSRLHLWEPLHLDANVCAVSGVTPWEYCGIALPADLNTCVFSKFIRLYFQNIDDYKHSKYPIRSSLLRLKNVSSAEAVQVFKLVLRFMEDENMTGVQQYILGNYIINKGIASVDLRDEIYTQLCRQLWKNPQRTSVLRGWLLMGLCLCTFPPTRRMEKYLLKYISDHAFEGYNKFIQKKCIVWGDDELATGRTYPPTLIEWKALKENALLSLNCYMADGYSRVIEVDSSSSCEEAARSFLSVRKMEDLDTVGWSFILNFQRLSMFAPGSEPMLDLVSILELPPVFPGQTANTLLSLDRTNQLPTEHMDVVIQSHNTPMNRVVPTYKHQESVFENKKIQDRQQQSPQPIVQDLLHLKESNAQLPESKLESTEIQNVMHSEQRREFDDAFTPRKYVSQPAFKVKNSEPSPQFYYQPQSVQKEYVYHVQKEEPVYVQNSTFVPVAKPPTEVQQVQRQEPVFQKHSFVTQQKPSEEIKDYHNTTEIKRTHIIRHVKPEPIKNKEIVHVTQNYKPVERDIDIKRVQKRDVNIKKHAFVSVPKQQEDTEMKRVSSSKEEIVYEHVYKNHDDYLARADILYPTNPAQQVDRIPLKDDSSVNAQIEKVEPDMFPMSKPPTPPPLPPIAVSNPPSTFTSRGNTLKRTKPIVHKKTPWSMEEVLLKHRQMKPGLDKRYHPSYADDPENINFDQRLLDKITDLKRSRERLNDSFEDEQDTATNPQTLRSKDQTGEKNHYGEPTTEIDREPTFKKQPIRKHYIDIDIDKEHQKREKEASQVILDARKGLRKSNTKNLQEEKTLDQPMVEQRTKDFDMDKLLNKNNLWLKDHGTLRPDKNSANSQESTNFLVQSKNRLRPAEYSNQNSGFVNSGGAADNDREPIKRNWVDPKIRRFPKQTVVDVTDDFRSADKRESPSILGSGGGSLSNASKKRLEEHAKRFEKRRNSSGSRASSSGSESNFVDSVFKGVFADNDLTSADALVNKLKGGGNDFYYPDRAMLRRQPSHRLSNNYNDSQSLDMLRKQQEQAEQRLHQNNAEKNNLFSHVRVSNDPPIQTTTPWTRVVPINEIDHYSTNNNHRHQNHQDGILSTANYETSKSIPKAPPPPPPAANKLIPVKGLANQMERHNHGGGRVVPFLLKGSYVSYTNTEWKIHLRKEIFLPKENLGKSLKEVIYRQILEDISSRTCCRLSGDDRYKVQKVIDSGTSMENDILKQKVINAAKELPLYFARIYKFEGFNEHLYNYIAISHSGVRLAARNSLDETLIVTSYIQYTTIVDLRVENNVLNIVTVEKTIGVHSNKAASMKKLISTYLKAAEKHRRYVKAINNHNSTEFGYLPFKKGNVIVIYEKENVQPGYMWGVFKNKQGIFPASCVEDFDTGSVSSAGWLPSIIPIYQKQDIDDFMSEDYDQYTLIDFAVRYFKASPTSDGVRVLNHDQEHPEYKYHSKMVQFSKEPLNGPLINYKNKTWARQAVDVNRGIMKFMGDVRRDQQENDNDLLYFLLKTGKENLDLTDEILCQLVKQTTFNTSENKESCSRGWKLLLFATSYFDCSSLLYPYLYKYFQSAGEYYKEFNGAATVCMSNLRRSFEYGGRKEFPSQNELSMMTQGKQCKYQVVYLPGKKEKLCKINTSTTVAVVIKDVCEELGLEMKEEHLEYGLFVYLHDKKVFLPLEEKEYIFDVVIKLEKDGRKQISLAFRKLVWFQAMRFANNRFTETIYDQVLPDVMNGFLLHHKGNRPSLARDQQIQNEVSLLAALQHRINNKHQAPTLQEVASLIPAIVAPSLKPEQWLEMANEHFILVRHFTAMNARIKFLELLSAWYYFGSSFFFIDDCNHSAINEKCVLAVNKNGVHFLSTSKRDTLLSFNFQEILSTSSNTNSDDQKMFVDLRCGDLQNQRVIRIETPRSKEISNLIQRYLNSIDELLRDKSSIMDYVQNN
uniref:Unconventional myosin-XV n=1 Tax=Clytia hemisphaerica TaxID=252671 RepID=A0A7M5V4L1_9CNID